MGTTESKRYIASKEDRVKKELKKDIIIKQQIEKIDQAQEQLWKDAKTSDLITYKEVNNILEIGNIAKSQLSRGGNNLTKSDLIAICLRLDPELKNKFSQLQNYTISDLNTMIRCIIYNVNTKNKSDLKLLI